jgi:hypothetical protein
MSEDRLSLRVDGILNRLDSSSQTRRRFFRYATSFDQPEVAIFTLLVWDYNREATVDKARFIDTWYVGLAGPAKPAKDPFNLKENTLVTPPNFGAENCTLSKEEATAEVTDVKDRVKGLRRPYTGIFDALVRNALEGMLRSLMGSWDFNAFEEPPQIRPGYERDIPGLSQVFSGAGFDADECGVG